MALKNKEGLYECPYCMKTFIHPQQADECRDSHELIYVAMTLDDLNRIVNYFYHPTEELIDPKLVTRLKKYLRRGITR